MANTAAEQARLEWNKVWDRPSQLIIGLGRHVYNRYLKRAFLPHATLQARFLEIGCGTASLLCNVAPCFKEVVGLDISEKALAKAALRAQECSAKNISFMQGDCFNLPFADESFDIIWSQGLHEHFDNYIDILREEYRVCKSGGYVYAGVPYRYSYPTVWYKISQLPFCAKLWPWTAQVFFKKNEILEVAQQVCPHAEAFVMRPWLLGILIVKMRKE